MPTGAPGLSNMRSGNAAAGNAMASFGQSMSGSQPAAALDLSWVSMKRCPRTRLRKGTPATFPLYPAPRKLNIRIQAKRYGLNDQRNKAKRNVSSKKRRILPNRA
jgi:hypothetical protein